MKLGRKDESDVQVDQMSQRLDGEKCRGCLMRADGWKDSLARVARIASFIVKVFCGE